MNTSALRAEIKQRLQKDPQGVIRALKTAGVKLSKQDETSVNQSWIDQFSDDQLQQRFNKQVLEALGIKGEMGGHYYKEGGKSQNQPQQYNSQKKPHGDKHPQQGNSSQHPQSKFPRQ
jgi:hypothetical protein